ncbi:MAG: hypothetical protein HWD86_12025 [Kangiellaceae bacterium]|nr:hypothetical protein [Kangiellaceae bacterium]
MLIWIAFSLIALAWAAWLFSGIFHGSSKKIIFLSMLLVAAGAGLFLYQQMGAHKEITQLADTHQQLAELSLSQLADKADNKEITIEQLMAELRLRNEIHPDNEQGWIQLGQVFIQFGRLQLADQAFSRAVYINDDDAIQLETARYFIDYAQQDALERAERKINLVLLEKPSHEGALLLQGINAFKQQNYQVAKDYWQRLLKLRDRGTESYNLIQQQIEMANRQLLLEQNNNIKIVVNNLSNIPLQSFTKAFAIVRTVDGGPPIAVKSVALTELKEPIKISPDNVMLPDVELWQAVDIKVEIRLSQSGFAQPNPGDLYGESKVQSNLTPGETFHITIDQTVK